MHDIRQNENPEPQPKPQPRPDIAPAGSTRPEQPAAQPRQFPDVNLHPDHAGHSPAPAPQTPAIPQTDWTAAPTTQPMREGVSYEVTGLPPQPAAPTPKPAPLPRRDENHHSLVNSLRMIKFGLLGLVVLLAVATFFFLSQTGQPNKSPDAKAPSESPGSQSVNGAEGGYAKSVSCFGQTGADATTDSKSFTDVEGTECTYRTGTSKETLVLTGKLTGRNTEGTGMSVTISVNDKVCSGGESLNYSRTFTPMISNCVFEVPANSAAAIKWQFLSPFGGSASVLRSSKNIAPSITGIAIPKFEEASGG